jgi:hypothetical protein
MIINKIFYKRAKISYLYFKRPFFWNRGDKGYKKAAKCIDEFYEKNDFLSSSFIIKRYDKLEAMKDCWNKLDFPLMLLFFGVALGVYRYYVSDSILINFLKIMGIFLLIYSSLSSFIRVTNFKRRIWAYEMKIVIRMITETNELNSRYSVIDGKLEIK